MSNVPSQVECYVWASDADNALEIAGNAADIEYRTATEALFNFDHEYHVGKRVYKIVCEEVAECDAKNALSSLG